MSGLPLAPTDHSTEQDSTEEGNAQSDERALFDLLLEVNALLDGLDSIVHGTLYLILDVLHRILNLTAHLVGAALHLVLELIDLVGGIRSLLVYFLTDLIC